MKKSVVASLASILCLNVVCLSFVTFAWFTAKNTVDNGVSDVFAVDGTVVEDIEIFNIRQDVDHVQGMRYFYDTPAANDVFVLAQYSPLEKRCQSLIKVKLSGSFSAIGISAQITSSDPYYIDGPDGSNADHKLKPTGNPLSNITSFEIIRTDAVDGDGNQIITHNTASSRYEMIFDENKTRSTFVNNDCTALTSTELNLGTLNNVSEFYILVGYNEKSIDKIYSNYLGESIISGETYKFLQFDVDYRFHLTDASGGNN